MRVDASDTLTRRRRRRRYYVDCLPCARAPEGQLLLVGIYIFLSRWFFLVFIVHAASGKNQNMINFLFLIITLTVICYLHSLNNFFLIFQSRSVQKKAHQQNVFIVHQMFYIYTIYTGDEINNNNIKLLHHNHMLCNKSTQHRYNNI